ncbi:MAG: hormogonium polysaccharide biosynthesis glycosyltransferase HpsP [Gomphosphaeria aponina SAG 52.96 = DSM 107014]|uniref:Hormogonium polysaccharide biosynthesis glycosyltransferase HpsP n=1 Tax=Gomphosphaeria aponina SAG 52.96 = DSM 107014 TaxID=1521640 RepID=A0A941JVP3_9CHRO|nr:hormogonium polysaccharide biosynthesis glycosyltransferase HpsP [Gomphosphaeria aponina SAG 52.96 = DSM 107014]
MKILQIVPSVSLVYGGPSQMVLSLSKAIASQGVDVTLLTTNANGDTGQSPLDVPIGQPVTQDNYKIIYFSCSPFRRYKFSLGLLLWLTHHAQEFDLAHIHALFSPVSTAAATIARWQNLPYILRPLGTLDPADLRKKAFLKQVYGRVWEKPNLAGAAGVHFTSAEECRISERFGSTTKDLVIPLGVELPANDPPSVRQELGIAPNVPLILFMSRIDQKKGLDLLIPALETLLNEGLAFHFVLAGTNTQNPDYEKGIQEKIERSKLGERTTITGFVWGDLKWGLLQDADLFVLPSDYENFGIAVAEAIAVGTPVVISDRVYIWEEIEKEKAGWVTPCEIPSLTTTLRLALQNSEERKQRGLNGRKLALSKYSWQALAKPAAGIACQMIEIYRGILNDRLGKDFP